MIASHPRETESLWLSTVDMPSFNSLSQNVNVDVCIVGGGIGGLTTAYTLLNEGKSVCVLESFEIASGQSGKTTAHFSNALDDRYYNLERFFGKDGAILAADSHTEAIRYVAEIVEYEKIDCDFEFLNGYLFATEKKQEEILTKEFAAAERARIFGVSNTQTLPISNRDSEGNPIPNICFPLQAQLHPGKYLKALAEIIVKNGGKIFTHTHAMEIKGGANAHVITRDGFRVDCGSIVVATNAPVNDRFTIHTKQYAYRTYAIAFNIPEGSIEKALYWDLAEPYHYARLQGSNILIVGGEDHKTGQDSNPEERFQKLESWSRKMFTMAGVIAYKWSGQVLEPMDHLAYLGRNPGDEKNVYIITGDSGHGMTHCTIGAMLITDQIMNRKNQWEHLYDPARVSILAVPTYLKENLNSAVQYADWITPKESEDLSELERGEGRVYRQGLQLVAAYKNEMGNVQTVSAVCTHLGGVVRWNTTEKSWDCPCHGSRFDVQGEVLEGPAIAALAKVTLEDQDEINDNDIDFRSGPPLIPAGP